MARRSTVYELNNDKSKSSGFSTVFSPVI
jgi:hypothetical protein